MTETDTHTDPEGTAWRIHVVLTKWTRKVDAKAGFALTSESTAMASASVISRRLRGAPGHERGNHLPWVRHQRTRQPLTLAVGTGSGALARLLG